MPTDTLFLSPSSLNRWFGSSPDMAIGCPKAFSLNKLWEPIVEEDRTALDRGTLIHSMLEGTTDPATVTDKVTLQMFSRLNNLREMFHLRILATELRQEFQIMPGVKWVRVIDAIAEDDKGKKLVIDYKSGMGWKTVETADGQIAPQAEGFQGIGYLIPPPETARKDWPKEAWFMISGYGGKGQIFKVLHTEAKEANLRSAIELVRFAHRKQAFPAVRGKHCFDCTFRSVCYETPGWQRLYRKKERRS